MLLQNMEGGREGTVRLIGKFSLEFELVREKEGR